MKKTKNINHFYLFDRKTKTILVIVVGDVNIVKDAIDLYDATRLLKGDEGCMLPFERNWLKAIVRGGDRALFFDAFRVHHATEERNYTYWSTYKQLRPLNDGWRIDYALLT